MSAPNIFSNTTQPAQQTPAVPGLDPNNPNSWTQYLTSLTNGAPNMDQYVKGYGLGTGLSPTGYYQASQGSKYLTPAEYYNLANQYGFYNSIQPEEHQALYQMLNQMIHPELMGQQYSQQAHANALSQGPQLQNQLASAGAGQGAKEGAALSLQNGANREANAYNANLFSPQGITQRAQGVAGIYNAAQPNLGNLGTLSSIQQGTPRNQSGASALGGIAGSLFGAAGNAGGFSSLFS